MNSIIKIYYCSLVALMIIGPICDALGFGPQWIPTISGISSVILLFSALFARALGSWEALRLLRYLGVILLGLIVIPPILVWITNMTGMPDIFAWVKDGPGIVGFMIGYFVVSFIVLCATKDWQDFQRDNFGPRVAYQVHALICQQCKSEIELREKGIEPMDATRDNLLYGLAARFMHASRLEYFCPQCGSINERRLPVRALLRLRTAQLIYIAIAILILAVTIIIVNKVFR